MPDTDDALRSGQPRPRRIAVDVMAGDLGPEEIVRGVLLAAAGRETSATLVLVGQEPVIRAELARHGPVPRNIEVRHASQTIEMTDKPSEAFRRKPDASVVVAARMVKAGEAEAFISIGHTGAAMAAAVFHLRTLPGIDRPALAVPAPSLRGPVALLDAGATVDCTAQQLLQFGVMGRVYARRVLGIEHPTIGLLSNGEEVTKGNRLTREAHKLLSERLEGFKGNVEGRDVFRGTTNVVVCDGFDGNIVLKTGEGVAEMVMEMVREELTRYQWMKLMMLPLRRGIRDLRARLDYREFGGAQLLGVNGVCVAGHGRSEARAIASAVRVAETAIACNLVREIEAAWRADEAAANAARANPAPTTQ